MIEEHLNRQTQKQKKIAKGLLSYFLVNMIQTEMTSIIYQETIKPT